MKKLVIVLAAAFALAIPASGTAKVQPQSTCGSSTCIGGGPPPKPCNYWSQAEYYPYGGSWWYCNPNDYQWYYEGPI